MESINNWEISIIELRNGVGRKYKVTRRIPEMSISETKIFRSKQRAKEQFEEWIASVPASLTPEGR